MARKKDTPQKAALREMMGNYLKENNVEYSVASEPFNPLQRAIHSER